MRHLLSLTVAVCILGLYATVGLGHLPDTGAFGSGEEVGLIPGALHGYFWPFNLIASLFGDSGLYEDAAGEGYLLGFVVGVLLLLGSNGALMLARLGRRQGSDVRP